MTRRAALIINPKSGSSADTDTLIRLRDFLRKEGYGLSVELTKSLDHAGDLARQARHNHCNLVIVAGGDGTVRTVVESMAGSEIPLLIVPGGTENLVACELGIDGTFKNLQTILRQGKVRNLDLGRVNQNYFIAVVGVGFDGEVIRRLNQFRAGHITHMDYLWPITRTFWEYQFPPLRVEADGVTVCDEPALVFVGNISRYAVELKIFPDADCGDGLLDLCIYKCSSRPRLLLHSLMTMLRQTSLSPGVIRRKCRHIRISGAPSLPVQYDGDPGPALPLEIEVIPTAARVLTPPAPAGQAYAPPVRFYHFRRWLK